MSAIDFESLEAGLLDMLKCNTCLPDQPGKMVVATGYRPPPYDEEITGIEDCAECEALPGRPALRDGVRQILRLARAAKLTPEQAMIDALVVALENARPILDDINGLLGGEGDPEGEAVAEAAAVARDGIDAALLLVRRKP